MWTVPVLPLGYSSATSSHETLCLTTLPFSRYQYSCMDYFIIQHKSSDDTQSKMGFPSSLQRHLSKRFPATQPKVSREVVPPPPPHPLLCYRDVQTRTPIHVYYPHADMFIFKSNELLSTSLSAKATPLSSFSLGFVTPARLSSNSLGWVK